MLFVYIYENITLFDPCFFLKLEWKYYIFIRYTFEETVNQNEKHVC